MRAKQFPRMLFETIHSAVGSPSIQVIPAHHPWEYFAILDEEKKPFGHIGYSQYYAEQGLGSKLGVWGKEIIDLGVVGKKAADPFIEIRGGPVRAGIWAMGQGNLYKEEVTASAGIDFYHRGINLRAPLIKLTSEVLHLAYALADKVELPPLSYWEAFRHPEQDFRDPP
jgi:hypothetical protein